MTLKLAVIGCGRMGKLHARIIDEMPNVELAGVSDTNPAVAEAIGAQRNCRWVTNPNDLIEHCDGAIISTPTISHIEVAEPFVKAGKSVLIEKPLTDDLAAGEDFIETAAANNAIVQVGHAERYNPAVMAMKKYAIQPKFIESHRISPYTFRSTDVGVVLDMMIHDIDIVLMLAGTTDVVSVEAVGVNVIGSSEDIANARVNFANGCTANITASRLAIKTERKVRVFSEEAYLSVDYHKKCGLVAKKSDNIDLLQMARKLDAEDLAEIAQNVDYRSMVNVEELTVDESTEPLRLQAEAFVQSICDGVQPEVSAEAGFAAVRLAKQITDAISRHAWDGDPSGRVGPELLADE